ncbi:MAG: YsnF/AvaK domain-containing protein, partial [Oscillochloris sp.]|nr:YsnF/AvaK domain-containing protein [Oscillochloris sp.]
VIDIDRRGSEWRQSGWRGFDPNAEPIRSEQHTSHSDHDRRGQHDERVLPVVEEEVDIGKRRVDKGGVRVSTRVEERPIEEDVHLRDERVNVERRRTDRPVTDSDHAAFKEESFEMHETTEEPVVRKRARVVEEVIIDRDVSEHTEHIHETARRTDVDISKTSGDDFDTSSYDRDYNTHFDRTYGTSGYSYDDYSPVYNYGAQLATSSRYRNRDWNDIEPEARRTWEQENPGTWDQFKDTIRYAWDRARNRH